LSVERWALRSKPQNSTEFVRPSVGEDILRSLDFFDCSDDLVKVRPVAGIEFGMEEFTIGANLKSAAARGNQRERFDALAELKNFGRQTDGLRRVVSNDAVLD
jgi:hypothetical protein